MKDIHFYTLKKNTIKKYLNTVVFKDKTFGHVFTIELELKRVGFSVLNEENREAQRKNA